MNRLSYIITCVIMAIALQYLAIANVAAQNIIINDEVQLKLGDAFMADEEYYRAITEYLKFTYMFPESPHKTYALLQVGMANYRGGEHAQAIQYFERVKHSSDKTYFSQAAFYEGVCYNALKKPLQAATAFEKAFYFDQQSEYAHKALAGISITATTRNDNTTAKQALQLLKTHTTTPAATQQAATALDILSDSKQRPHKSSALAGCMSAIIPGSGHIYAGRNKDGFMAFIINGLFIAGTCVAIDHENYPVAAITAGAGFPFYIGNIYGAANAAHKWNVSLQKDIGSQLAITLNYNY